MVRWVFRPFTQVYPPICTLGRIRSSSTVSGAFDLLKQRSPSFGSPKHYSYSDPSPRFKTGRRCHPCRFLSTFTFITLMVLPTKSSQCLGTPWLVLQDEMCRRILFIRLIGIRGIKKRSAGASSKPDQTHLTSITNSGEGRRKVITPHLPTPYTPSVRFPSFGFR